MTLAIRCFWSYSRTSADLGAFEYCQSMQASLQEELGLIADVSIFFDTTRETGVPSGADWSETIIRSISQTALFFWFQSPRWLSRPNCRFELDMFSASVDDIAKEFSTTAHPIDPKKLLARLITPVRWADVTDGEWDLLPDTIRGRYEHLWKSMHVADALNIPARHKRHLVTDNVPRRNCEAVKHLIKMDLLNAIPSLGSKIAPLLQFLQSNREEFVRRWLEEFEDRNLFDLRNKRDISREKNTSLSFTGHVGTGHVGELPPTNKIGVNPITRSNEINLDVLLFEKKIRDRLDFYISGSLIIPLSAIGSLYRLIHGFLLEETSNIFVDMITNNDNVYFNISNSGNIFLCQANREYKLKIMTSSDDFEMLSIFITPVIKSDSDGVFDDYIEIHPKLGQYRYFQFVISREIPMRHEIIETISAGLKSGLNYSDVVLKKAIIRSVSSRLVDELYNRLRQIIPDEHISRSIYVYAIDPKSNSGIVMSKEACDAAISSLQSTHYQVTKAPTEMISELLNAVFAFQDTVAKDIFPEMKAVTVNVKEIPSASVVGNAQFVIFRKDRLVLQPFFKSNRLWLEIGYPENLTSYIETRVKAEIKSFERIVLAHYGEIKILLHSLRKERTRFERGHKNENAFAVQLETFIRGMSRNET